MFVLCFELTMTTVSMPTTIGAVQKPLTVFSQEMDSNALDIWRYTRPDQSQRSLL